MRKVRGPLFHASVYEGTSVRVHGRDIANSTTRTTMTTMAGTTQERRGPRRRKLVGRNRINVQSAARGAGRSGAARRAAGAAGAAARAATATAFASAAASALALPQLAQLCGILRSERCCLGNADGTAEGCGAEDKENY